MDEMVPLPVDESAELAEIGRPDWAPRDDAEIERALRLLDRLAARFVKVKAQASAWRSEIDSWESAEVGKIQGPATRASLGLEAFALAERNRTGTKSFVYPSGTIETRRGRDSIGVTDEDALLMWCQVNCPEAIKTTVTVLTSRLPGKAAPDGQLVTEDGDIVPGVSVRNGEHYTSATVKLASQRALPGGKS